MRADHVVRVRDTIAAAPWIAGAEIMAALGWSGVPGWRRAHCSLRVLEALGLVELRVVAEGGVFARKRYRLTR